jgi:hypothetical protein
MPYKDLDKRRENHRKAYRLHKQSGVTTESEKMRRREAVRRYGLKHPERVKEASIRYRSSEAGKKKYEENYQRKKEYLTVYSRMRRYNASQEEIETLLERGKRDGCAICGCKDRQLVLDHNHITKQIRGMLCKRHNLLIVGLDAHPDELQAINAYLKIEIKNE